MNGSNGGRHYGVGVAVVITTAILIVWTTIVRDDGTGMNGFLIIMAVGVGGFAARFTAAGMARTMVGVGAMQALLGLATATAPVTAAVSDGIFKAIVSNGLAAALWLSAAALFRAAARNGTRAAA